MLFCFAFLWFCCLLVVVLVAVCFFSHGGIISLVCTTNQKPVTASASIAVIHTASKYLHNDLARAIKALEQKKKPLVPRDTEESKDVGLTHP